MRISDWSSDVCSSDLVVQELCRLGVRVRAVCRNTQGALFLKPLGGLGQVQIAGADISRPDSLASAVAGSSAAINLVGIFKGDFELVQADGAEALAQPAPDAGPPANQAAPRVRHARARPRK